eukprot:m.81146 g.81146  ORF g.81146 m.81146 type:complete len:1479 (+) comp36223_c0_seq1:160-4596(+)
MEMAEKAPVFECSYRTFKPEDFSYDDRDKEEGGDFVGSGACADVFQAKLKESGEFVAAKVFFQKNRSRTRGRLTLKELDDLKQEAEILSRLQDHPNVIKLIGVCPARDQYTLLLEFVDGPSLSYLLQSKSPEIQPWNVRLDICMQISEGMCHLHSERVLHLDLKPDNIVTCKQQGRLTCKVADFGLSRVYTISAKSSKRKSAEGFASGTPGYIAPERYSSNSMPSAKSDVWSFGVILWEISEKMLISETERPNVIVGRFQREILPALKKLVPPGFEELYTQCCSSFPEERPDFESVKHLIHSIKKTAKRFVMDLLEGDGEDFKKFCQDFDLDSSAIAVLLQSARCQLFLPSFSQSDLSTDTVETDGGGGPSLQPSSNQCNHSDTVSVEFNVALEWNADGNNSLDNCQFGVSFSEVSCRNASLGILCQPTKERQYARLFGRADLCIEFLQRGLQYRYTVMKRNLPSNGKRNAEFLSRNRTVILDDDYERNADIVTYDVVHVNECRESRISLNNSGIHAAVDFYAPSLANYQNLTENGSSEELVTKVKKVIRHLSLPLVVDSVPVGGSRWKQDMLDSTSRIATQIASRCIKEWDEEDNGLSEDLLKAERRRCPGRRLSSALLLALFVGECIHDEKFPTFAASVLFNFKLHPDKQKLCCPDYDMAIKCLTDHRRVFRAVCRLLMMYMKQHLLHIEDNYCYSYCVLNGLTMLHFLHGSSRPFPLSSRSDANSEKGSLTWLDWFPFPQNVVVNFRQLDLTNDMLLKLELADFFLVNPNLVYSLFFLSDFEGRKALLTKFSSPVYCFMAIAKRMVEDCVWQDRKCEELLEIAKTEMLKFLSIQKNNCSQEWCLGATQKVLSALLDIFSFLTGAGQSTRRVSTIIASVADHFLCQVNMLDGLTPLQNDPNKSLSSEHKALIERYLGDFNDASSLWLSRIDETWDGGDFLTLKEVVKLVTLVDPKGRRDFKGAARLIVKKAKTDVILKVYAFAFDWRISSNLISILEETIKAGLETENQTRLVFNSPTDVFHLSVPCETAVDTSMHDKVAVGCLNGWPVDLSAHRKCDDREQLHCVTSPSTFQFVEKSLNKLLKRKVTDCCRTVSERITTSSGDQVPLNQNALGQYNAALDVVSLQALLYSEAESRRILLKGSFEKCKLLRAVAVSYRQLLQVVFFFNEAPCILQSILECLDKLRFNRLIFHWCSSTVWSQPSVAGTLEEWTNTLLPAARALVEKCTPWWSHQQSIAEVYAAFQSVPFDFMQEAADAINSVGNIRSLQKIDSRVVETCCRFMKVETRANAFFHLFSILGLDRIYKHYERDCDGLHLLKNFAALTQSKITLYSEQYDSLSKYLPFIELLELFPTAQVDLLNQYCSGVHLIVWLRKEIKDLPGLWKFVSCGNDLTFDESTQMDYRELLSDLQKSSALFSDIVFLEQVTGFYNFYCCVKDTFAKLAENNGQVSMKKWARLDENVSFFRETKRRITESSV